MTPLDKAMGTEGRAPQNGIERVATGMAVLSIALAVIWFGALWEGMI